MVLIDAKKFEPEVAKQIEQFAIALLDKNATGGIVSGRKLLDTMTSQLWEREVVVLTNRYALEGGKALSLEETSAKLGVPRERIDQIEAKAFMKLRRPQVMQFFSSRRTSAK